MTRDEVIQIMSVLRGAYPQFYRNIEKREALNTIALWEDMFRDDDPILVGAAVKSIIASDDKGFPPTIGQVKTKMASLVRQDEMTEQEAWNIISKATKNGIYGSKEEFEKLPPVLQKLVGSAEQLRTWAMMDSETLHSVVSSNIQRSYKVVKERQRQLEALPSDVKVLISGMAQKLSIEAPVAQKQPSAIEGAVEDRCDPEKIRKIMADAGIPMRLSEEEIQSKKSDMISRLRGE